MQYVLDVQHLVKSYGKQKALYDITFSVRPGTCFGLLGPNGAGKSTTMKILASIVEADGGTAKVFGMDVVKQRHTIRRKVRENYPTELVFDLDPPDANRFDLVLEVALQLNETLRSLGFASVPKTSGAKGMQICVPIDPRYTFEQARQINTFIAKYMIEQMPEKMTLERAVAKRGNKLYFDYLQLWKGRTMPAPYSVRAKPEGTFSAPVTWEEVAKGFDPADFTMHTMHRRISENGDLFSPITTERRHQNVDHILSFIQTHF